MPACSNLAALSHILNSHSICSCREVTPELCASVCMLGKGELSHEKTTCTSTSTGKFHLGEQDGILPNCILLGFSFIGEFESSLGWKSYSSLCNSFVKCKYININELV